MLKTYGYATGQFGKNHLGDRNEHLPTVHGFDKFFGNDSDGEPAPELARGCQLVHTPAAQEMQPEREAARRYGLVTARMAVQTGSDVPSAQRRPCV